MFLEQQAFIGAMPLVSDVGSLSFLERHSSGASHWLPMSVHCRFLSDGPMVLCHWCVGGSQSFLERRAFGSMPLVADVSSLSFFE